MERLNPVDIKIIIATHKNTGFLKTPFIFHCRWGLKGKKIWAM